MKLISVSSFYRMPFDQKARVEDGFFINARTGIFGVADGVSEAYSPGNPPLIYPGRMTGGQMAVNKFCSIGNFAVCSYRIENLLQSINRKIGFSHQKMGKDPVKDDVGGAVFAACQIEKNGITFVIAGDCFIIYQDNNGVSFLTGFDQSAFDIEDQDNKAYTNYLEKAGGNKGLAWDMYLPEYKAKRIRCSNKNIGNGGYAILNGDPALKECWKVEKINWSSEPRFILLGTDGLLSSAETNPKNRLKLIEKIIYFYVRNGIEGILKWRDETERSLSHITGWPEATALVLNLR
ncbi:MAG: hypothetical protein AAB474_01575 [Patescibacteria group bacterium]